MVATTRFGRFEVIRDLENRGANAILSLAFDHKIREVVVLKRLGSQHRGAAYTDRFADEVALGVQLQHANLVRIIDGGDIDGVSFLEMEWIRGQSLANLTQNARNIQYEIPHGVWASIFRQILNALAYAHSKAGLDFVHRDISPGNVMVTYDGTAKLIDFGFASFKQKVSKTSVGSVLGTESFIAPERLEGKPADAAGDIYSLGAVFWSVLTGTQPPEQFAPPPTAVLIKRLEDAGVKASLASVVAQAMASDPSNRFQSALAMASALDAAIELAPLSEVGGVVKGLFAGAYQVAEEDQALFKKQFAATPPDVARDLSKPVTAPLAMTTAVIERTAEAPPKPKAAQTMVIDRTPRRTEVILAITVGVATLLAGVAAIAIHFFTRPPLTPTASQPAPHLAQAPIVTVLTSTPPVAVPVATAVPTAPSPPAIPSPTSAMKSHPPALAQTPPAASHTIAQIDRLLTLNNLEPARDLCAELEADPKTHAIGLLTHARVQLQAHEYDDAVALASKAMHAGAGSRSLMIRAQAELRQNNATAAARDFKAFLKTNPTNQDAIEGLKIAEPDQP